MFGFFKRKDKDNTRPGQSEEEWGRPTHRKMSKDEAAREAAAQKMVEEKGLERRNMYRLPGRERIFEDVDGRRLALRTEDNTGPKASPHHPPLQIVAFWGTRQVAGVRAELVGSTLRQLAARVEGGYEKRGIGQELLKELETLARQKGAAEICCTGSDDNEWNAALLAEAGYTARGGEMIKAL